MKLFHRVQSTQDEKARFIKGNELKLTLVELFSFLFFKRVPTEVMILSNSCFCDVSIPIIITPLIRIFKKIIHKLKIMNLKKINCNL